MADSGEKAINADADVGVGIGIDTYWSIGISVGVLITGSRVYFTMKACFF